MSACVVSAPLFILIFWIKCEVSACPHISCTVAGAEDASRSPLQVGTCIKYFVPGVLSSCMVIKTRKFQTSRGNGAPVTCGRQAPRDQTKVAEVYALQQLSANECLLLGVLESHSGGTRIYLFSIRLINRNRGVLRESSRWPIKELNTKVLQYLRFGLWRTRSAGNHTK